MTRARRWWWGLGAIVASTALYAASGCSETSADAVTGTATGDAQASGETGATNDASSTPGDAGLDATQADADAATAVLAIGFAHVNAMDTRVASVTFDTAGFLVGYAAPQDGLSRLDAAVGEIFTDPFVHALRFAEGEIRSTIGDASFDDTYPVGAGQHLGVVRVNVASLPASGQATYSLLHATKPSRPFGGGIGEGSLVNGKLQVTFGGAAGTRAGLTLDLAFDAGTTQIVGNGGATTPGAAGTSRFMGDGGTWLVEVPGVATSTGAVCDGGTCVNTFAYVLFAGPNAERAIVLYQFRDSTTSSAPGLKPSGVAIFAKQ
jgi:hypothetical protein